MNLNKKAVAIICTLYFVCVSSIILNTHLILTAWKQKNREKKNLKKHLLRCQLLINKALIDIGKKRARSKNKKRSYEWWEKIVKKEFSDQDWLENFRVGKETFQYIVEELKEVLRPKDNFLNNTRVISCVEKKVAVTLIYLASVCEYRVVGHTFGIYKSTVHNIVHECVLAVNQVLLPRYIKFPSEAEAIESASFFVPSTRLPNIIGAIDGTHIPIKRPDEGHRDFINRKGWASIILQGVVDAKYRFIDICVKNPEATHDAAVLAGSDLYKNIHNIMPKISVDLERVAVPYVLLGNPAYPLLPWLVKPYSNRGITPEQDSHNIYTSSGRVVVENAFGRLKARWRRLLKQCDMNYKFIPKLIATCCTLHNIIETRKVHFMNNWLEEVERADIIFPQPNLRTPTNTRDSYEAHNLREHLCNYLSNNFPLRASRQIM